MDPILIIVALAFGSILCLLSGTLFWFRYNDTKAFRALKNKHPAPVRDLDKNIAASFEIRPMDKRDYPEVRELEGECFRHSYVDPFMDVHQWLTAEGPPHASYVATVDGKVVGYTHLELTRPELFLAWLGVAETMRSHGVGAQLAKYVIEVVAPSLGCTHVRLTVRQSNYHAARLYRSLGFEYVRDIDCMHEVKVACPVGVAVQYEG